MRARRTGRTAAPGGTLRAEVAAAALYAGRRPAEAMLTGALRRAARRKPGVFERLGPFADAAFVVAPDGLPVVFQLRPSGMTGTVRVARRGQTAGARATVRGPFGDLLGVFTGALDADSAFFSRRIAIEGDTEAVVTLHNTLEAAELDVADLVNLGPRGAAAAAQGLRLLGRLAQAMSSLRRRWPA